MITLTFITEIKASVNKENPNNKKYLKKYPIKQILLFVANKDKVDRNKNKKIHSHNIRKNN